MTSSPTQPRLAVIVSRFNPEVTEGLLTGARGELEERGVPLLDIDLFQVPGAFEIPLHAKKLAESGRYAAVVCCGLVVDGGIYRHDFVAGAVINGLMSVQLETGVPVFSAVLTPLHFHEHETHLLFFTEHFLVKGKEAAQACLQTLASLQKMQALLG